MGRRRLTVFQETLGATRAWFSGGYHSLVIPPRCARSSVYYRHSFPPVSMVSDGELCAKIPPSTNIAARLTDCSDPSVHVCLSYVAPCSPLFCPRVLRGISILLGPSVNPPPPPPTPPAYGLLVYTQVIPMAWVQRAR